MSYCPDKNRYPDKRAARFALNQRLHSHYRRPDFLRIYHCPHCRGWHLTHRERHQRRQRPTPQPSLEPRPRHRRRTGRRRDDLGLNFYDS